MNHSVTAALWSFSERYVAAWKQQHGSAPQSDAYIGLPSPCVVQETEEVVIWNPVAREEMAGFDNVESAIELRLHDDIKEFYGSQFAGDMSAKLEGVSFELIQVWNEEDLPRLQENILGHLVTQRRRKLNPTVFIASTAAELDVVSICNLSGEVILERLGTSERQVLAPDVASFLNRLEPEV